MCVSLENNRNLNSRLFLKQLKMSRPSKIQKKDVGALSSVNCGHGAPEGTNLAEAAALLECQIAIIKSLAEDRTALRKHQALIAPKLAQALERVGSYSTNEVTFTFIPHPPLTFRLLRFVPPRALLREFFL